MKRLLSLCLLILIFACSSQEQLTIPKDKMVAILVDVHLAEAAMQRLVNKVKDTVSVRYYEEIFEIHQITEEIYLENLHILERNPALSKKIYEETMSKVTAMDNGK